MRKEIFESLPSITGTTREPGDLPPPLEQHTHYAPLKEVFPRNGGGWSRQKEYAAQRYGLENIMAIENMTPKQVEEIFRQTRNKKIRAKLQEIIAQKRATKSGQTDSSDASKE